MLLAMAAWASPAFVAGARTCVGERYDASYHAGGPTPPGRGACPEVPYYAFKAIGRNLQKEVNADIRRQPGGYPLLRDDNIDYRWCPNLIVWFKRHTRAVLDWQPGDVVFWSLTGDGVADHVGVVSDRKAGARYLVIHNFPPACTEDDSLGRWAVVGHFRLPPSARPSSAR